MQVRQWGWCMVLAAVSPVFGQWESGSDGSDGAFSPAVSTQVDLSLAASLCDCDGDTQVDDPCRWDCPSPVAGRGVYDAEQWVVVFKYTTVDVPSGATITFGMHPSGAPVVWLATGNVTISGAVNIDGEDSVNPDPSIIPYFTRPGPGGFQGGQAWHAGAPGVTAFGFGPGSSPTTSVHNSNCGSAPTGGAASHRTGPVISDAGWCPTGASGSAYGSAGALPLVGGSGGSCSPNSGNASGGAGGGAILIASSTQLTVGSAGTITAEGGRGANEGGGGSGGGIRLRSDSIVLSLGSLLRTTGGDLSDCGSNCSVSRAGDGPIRIEAGAITNLGTISGSQSFPGAPSPVFAAAPPPQLYVTAVCGQAAPAEPEWGIYSTDIDLNSASACTVNIEGSGMPVGTIVVVRAIPARGNIISVNSTPMVDAGGGLRTATASVTFPAGRSELQLRANW